MLLIGYDSRLKMTEITFKLEDDVIKNYGELYIKNFVEKQMEYLSLLRQMDNIEKQINISKMDYDKELENIRQKAWENYKEDFNR
jgi:dTDP-4-amino-4,6-dideoxygalactose transaminase